MIAFVFWIFMLIVQLATSKYSGHLKSTQSRLNDERLKVVNDIVVGCKTIKCYGWENHYTTKV